MNYMTIYPCLLPLQKEFFSVATQGASQTGCPWMAMGARKEKLVESSSLCVRGLTSFIAPAGPTMAYLVIPHPNMHYFGPNQDSYYSFTSNLCYFSEVPSGMLLQLGIYDKDKHTCTNCIERSVSQWGSQGSLWSVYTNSSEKGKNHWHHPHSLKNHFFP